MRLAFARGWLPALVWYADGLAEGIGAMSLAFVVVVRPKYRDDRGLHEHEFEHVAQWYAVLAAALLAALVASLQTQPGAAAGLLLASVGLHGFLCRHWRKFRLLCEAQAYGRQIRFPDRRGSYLSLVDAAARLCSTRYDLRLSRDEAMAWISGQGGAGSGAPH